jgi:hypothetical protein
LFGGVDVEELKHYSTAPFIKFVIFHLCTARAINPLYFWNKFIIIMWLKLVWSQKPKQII